MDAHYISECDRLERVEGFLADDAIDQLFVAPHAGALSACAWAGALICAVCVILTLV